MLHFCACLTALYAVGIRRVQVLGDDFRLRHLTKLFWKRFVFGAAIPLFLRGEAAKLALIIGDYDLSSRRQLVRLLLGVLLSSSVT